MANAIKIQLQIDGKDVVFRTLDELQKELSDLQDQLQELELDLEDGIDIPIGMDIDRLKNDIGKLEGAVATVQQQGVNAAQAAEKSIASFIKLGGALTSGFAAAKSVLSLFGSEGEDLNRAAIKAQTSLTIALAASAIAQESATLVKIKDTAVTIANTLAQQGLIASLRLLWATMVANPITAVLAVLGTLLSALVIFADETEEAAEKQKTLSETMVEAAQASAMETEKLEILTDIINDNNVSLDARLGAYEQLQKILPELANYTLDEAQAMGILNKAYEREIELIKLRAKAKGLEDFIAQQEKERIATLVANEQKAEAGKRIQELIDLQKEYARASAGGFMGTIEDFEKQNQQFRELGQNLSGISTATKKRTVIEQELYDITVKISELEKQRNDDIKTGVDRTNRLKKSEEERNKARQAFIDLLLKQLKLEEQLFTQTFDLKELDNELLKTTENNISTAEGYAKSLTKLKSITVLLNDAVKDFSDKNDVLGKAFLEAKKQGEDFIDGAEKGAKSIEEFKERIEDLGKTLDEQQKNELRTFSENYIELYETFDRFREFKGGVLPQGLEIGNFQQVVTDLNLALGRISIDPYTGRTDVELAQAKATARERYEIYKQSFLDEYELYLQADLRKKGLTEKEIQDRKEGIRAIAEETFNTLSGIGDNLLKFEAGVKQTSERIIELNKQLQQLGPEARRGLIIENAQEIANEYAGVLTNISKTDEELYNLRDKLRRKDYTEESKYNDTLVGLKESLKARGIDISELEYAEQLVLLEAFLSQEVELTKNAEDKKQKARQETTDKILNTIQEFKSAITSISQTIADFYSAQLNNLERENEDINNKIVGDTEEANQKRLEQEKIYQTKKKELEKKATLSSLRFSQVQAAANVAEAITKALTAGPIAGQIAAAITAAMGVVQIGIIQSQISSAQSYQRGGLIRGMGGLLVGPSHEYGGIRYGAQGLELEGGEAVINRNSRLRYSQLLNQINVSGGGRPLVQNNFDDSRIVEAIAKQRNEPIRAYVVESDITNKQAVSKRLERLSQF